MQGERQRQTKRERLCLKLRCYTSHSVIMITLCLDTTCTTHNTNLPNSQVADPRSTGFGLSDSNSNSIVISPSVLPVKRILPLSFPTLNGV